ncbi:MAG: response regulator [Firmicutes bacterium]|nr:response regulator [Bacillota bacterium]
MKRLRVLLVDDEIMIREGFKRLFDWESHDCEVVGEAADGMEALSQIDVLQPDLVIMDINIPIMNGLKVIQLSRIKHPATAFIIVSGYDDFSYCREALRLQITDYILKPVNYEEFGNCIDNLKISMFERRMEEQPVLQEERPINGITRYLQEHLAEDVSLGVLSEEFHLNPQYISQLFKSEIGVNFLTYLTNIRMEKAKKLLLSTALSIAEVSEQSGYEDYRVFTKVFKKAEGITPSQYRRDFLEAKPEERGKKDEL